MEILSFLYPSLILWLDLDLTYFSLNQKKWNKTKLQKEGIIFLIHLFARDILLMKKLEIVETKTT